MALTQVSASGIKDGSISSNDLADGSITTAKIADDAITADKLNNTGVTAGSYTLSSVTVDAQGRVTAASSGTPVDADKIIEGNTEVEAVDTGSDGHIKATTEGTERLRVGPAGQVGIGGANYGTTGQVLMSGGASAAPTWGDVSSSPTFEATASGALTDGAPVIINSDGTVSAIAEDSATHNIGSLERTFGNSFTSALMQPMDVVYCPDIDKVVVFMKNGNNDYTYAAAGSVNASNETTSWGSAVLVASTNMESDGTGFVATWDSNINRVVIHYRDKSNSDKGTVQLIEVASNNTITVGSQHIFNNDRTTYIASAFDSSQNKHFVFFGSGNSDLARYRFASISTSSFNYSSQFDTSQGNGDSVADGDATFDSDNNRIIYAYRNASNNDGYVRVFTISGNTVTINSRETFNTQTPQNIRVAYNADKEAVVVAFNAGSDQDKGKVRSATYNTAKTAFTSWGNTVIYESFAHYNRDLAYSPKSKSVLLFYRDESITGGRNRYVKVTTSGTAGNTTSVDQPTDSVAETGHDPHVVFDTTNNRYVFVVRRTTSSINPTNQAYAIVYRQAYTSTNLAANNFVGISDAAYSNGQTATIQVVGSVDDAQSGLTAGSKYFVQGNGTLATTADTPSVEAGVALSATKLLIK